MNLFTAGFLLFSCATATPVSDKAEISIKEIVKNPETTLIDVRVPEEFAEKTADGAVNIPLDQIQNRISEFKDKKNIVTFCVTGQRSAKAIVILKQNGIETMSKQPGTGEYMSIAMGYSVYGTDIYVREDQKAKAEALINELLYDNDYNTFEDEDIKLPWWQNKVIVAKCILGFFILVIIIMIASQIFQ